MLLIRSQALLIRSQALLIVVAVATFFYPVFLQGKIPLPSDMVVGAYHPWLDYKWGYVTGVPVKNPITSDAVSLIYPEQMLGVDLIKLGEFPLWNPYILTGTPLFANLQAAPFSPTNFLYFLFETLSAWSLQIVFQHLLAALFSFLLLRHWNVSKFGSVLGGIAFAFSGFNLIFSQWNGHTLASSFIPLAVLFEDRYLKKHETRDGVLLSLTLVFQLLSGYPQISLYTALAIVILWGIRFYEERGFKFVKKTVLLAFFLLLALSLAAFQILPTLELWRLSQRSFEPNSFTWTFLPWSKIITFLAPDYFGNHATGNYWGPQDYTSNTGYVGVVVFVLATLGLGFLKAKRAVLFLFTLLIFSLVLSFPTPLSIFLWGSDVFGMQAASAHRATVLFNFAASLLSGFGFDYLLSRRKPQFKYALIFPSFILGGFLFVTVYLIASSQNFPKYSVGLRNLVLPIAIFVTSTLILWFIARWDRFKKLGLVSLSFLLLFELFRFGWKFTPFSERRLVFPRTPILDFLISQEQPFRVTGNKVIPVNLRTPYKLDSLEGYETIHPVRISHFLAALNSQGIDATPTGRYGIVDNDTSHLLDLVNTKYYLAYKLNQRGEPDPSGNIPERFREERFKLAFEDKSVAILESKTVLPRAFLVYDWETEGDPEEILTKLLDPNYPFSSKIILEQDPQIERTAADMRNEVLCNEVSCTEVFYQKYKEQGSIIEVKTDREGLLFVSDSWYPGFRAYVDGRETRIYRANYTFRAVIVPRGTHEVRFLYSPESFKIGRVISSATLFILVALFVADKYGIARRIKIAD